MTRTADAQPRGRLRRLVSTLIADQRVRFLFVGGINTVVGYGIFSVVELTLGRTVTYIGSLVIAQVLASILAFVLYRRIVFGVRGNLLVDFLRFQTVYIIPFLCNLLALPVLVSGLRWNVYLAQASIVVVTTIVSFFGHKYFSFRRRPVDETGADALSDTNGRIPVSRGALRSGSRWRAFIGIGVLAVVAWGAVAIFAPNAIYWDDWVLDNGHDISFYSQLGLPWMGYVNTALLALGPWSFKVVEVVATILTGWLAYLISGQGLRLPRWQRWLVAAFITVLPLNTARASVAVLDTYGLSLLVFFVAWWLLVRRSPNAGRGIPRYIIAAVLLVVSYTTASLLPFTILPIAHLMFLTIRADQPFIRGVLRFIGRFWYVLAAPFVYWIIKTVFFAPYGVYTGYNSFVSLKPPFTLTDLASALMLATFVAALVLLFITARLRANRGIGRRVVTLLLSFMVCCVGAVLYGIKLDYAVTSYVVPVAIILAGLVLVVVSVIAIAQRRDTGHLAVVLGVGLVAMALALLPYLLVGKIPSFQLWDTRSQLLMPVGAAILVVGAISSLSGFAGRRPARVIGLVATAGFACASLLVSLHLVADWNKQEQVIQALRQERLVENSSTIVFVDHAASLGYDSRYYTFYQLTGWLETAYGNQKRLGVSQTDLASYLSGRMLKGLGPDADRYGYGQFHPSDSGAVVTISPTPGANWVRLLLGEKSVTLSVAKTHGLSPKPAP